MASLTPSEQNKSNQQDLSDKNFSGNAFPVEKSEKSTKPDLSPAQLAEIDKAATSKGTNSPSTTTTTMDASGSKINAAGSNTAIAGAIAGAAANVTVNVTVPQQTVSPERNAPQSARESSDRLDQNAKMLQEMDVASRNGRVEGDNQISPKELTDYSAKLGKKEMERPELKGIRVNAATVGKNEVYERLDADNSGVLTVDEVKKAANAAGMKPSDKAITGFIGELEKSKSQFDKAMEQAAALRPKEPYAMIDPKNQPQASGAAPGVTGPALGSAPINKVADAGRGTP